MTRTCLVTGAASGIGAATSALLKRSGYRIIGIDLHEADIIADLGTEAGRKHTLLETERRAGGVLDAIVTAAGVLGRGADTLSINYFGTTSLLQGLLPLLAKSHSPRAVAVGSVAAYFPNDPGLVDMLLAGDEAGARGAATAHTEIALYASSKAALTAWCRRTAIRPDWAGQKVLLNVVAPGLVETGMNRDTFSDARRRAAVTAMMPAPLGRHAQPAEIAELIGFLVSPANSFTLGQVVFCDGGQEALQRGMQL